MLHSVKAACVRGGARLLLRLLHCALLIMLLLLLLLLLFPQRPLLLPVVQRRQLLHLALPNGRQLTCTPGLSRRLRWVHLLLLLLMWLRQLLLPMRLP